MKPNWYTDKIKSQWNRRKVKATILSMIRKMGQEGDEYLDRFGLEDLVFGERIEHKPCGSMNLPGAPECWGCEEPLK